MESMISLPRFNLCVPVATSDETGIVDVPVVGVGKGRTSAKMVFPLRHHRRDGNRRKSECGRPLPGPVLRATFRGIRSTRNILNVSSSSKGRRVFLVVVVVVVILAYNASISHCVY